MNKPNDVLRFINDFMSENGMPPTFRDIQAGLGLSSTSTVDYWLRSLEADGFIERKPGLARGIRLTNEGLELAYGNGTQES